MTKREILLLLLWLLIFIFIMLFKIFNFKFILSKTELPLISFIVFQICVQIKKITIRTIFILLLIELKFIIQVMWFSILILILEFRLLLQFILLLKLF